MATRVIAVLALLAAVAWGIHAAWPRGELRDYGSFIASGRAGTEGQNPYGIHPLTFHVVLPGFEVWNPNLNPPISIPLFALLDRLEPQRGFVIWWWVSLLCYLCAVALLTRRYGAHRSWLLPLWAMALAGFWDTLALGQIYVPLVLAAAGAWLLLDRGRALAAGVLIGIVIAIKPNFGVWPMLLLLAGHWRVSAIAIGTAGAISAVPLITHGVSIYHAWFALILSDEDRGGFLTNASITGLTQRVGFDSAGVWLSAALLAALAAWAVGRKPDALRASAFGILGGIAASPIAWVHYTLFLLPVFFATARWTRPMIVAAALLVIPVPLLLHHLDAPAWQQVTAGSAYNWAVLLCLAGFSGATIASVPTGPRELTIVFYDGVCGLCDRYIHFLLARDRDSRLRFAQLQGPVARRELAPAGHDPAQLDSVVAIAAWGTPRQRVLARSRAVLHAVEQLGGTWAMAARAARIVPAGIADALYGFIARRRYRLFGQFDTCPMPRPEWRDRFVDEMTTWT